MPLDSTTRMHLDDLARLRRAVGWVTLLVPVLFAASGLVAGAFCGMLLSLVGHWFLVVAGVLWSFRSMLKWREVELARLAEEPGEPRRAPWLARLLPWLAGLYALDAVGVPFQSALYQWLASFEWWEVGEALPPAPLDEHVGEIAAFAWLTVVMGLVTAVLAPWFQTTSREIAPEARGVASWMRASTFFAFAAAVPMFFRAYGEPLSEEGFQLALAWVLVVVGAELLLRAVAAAWKRFYDGDPHPGARVATDVLLLQLLASRFNPVSSLFAVLADVFGIDLKGTWALTFIRRSLAPLAVGLTLVGWLATAVVMVPTTDVGVHERFGRRAEETLGPGLHFVLPWPMHRVVRVPMERVRSIPIGYLGALEDASMLWTVAHAEEEHNLLLGNGRDLVTVNAELHWRVADPIAFTYAMQNPEEALAVAADRVLMTKTVGRTLDGVLSENLAVLAVDFRESIQAAVDEQGIGIEVVDFTLMGLHPPIDVSPDYQAVVAAQIERDRLVIEAEAYGEEQLPRAEGDAAALLAGAREHRVTRLATARGEARAFETLLASYLMAPDLFRLLWYLERLEAHLAGRRFHVIDHAIEADGGAIWLLE